MSEIIKSGEDLYLCYQGDAQKYIATVYPGTVYWFPTLGSNRVKIQLRFRGSELQEGSQVKIVTDEQRPGNQNILGAFSDAKECYYWTDIQADKQLWQVTPLVHRPSKKIHVGDRVALNNLSFADQRLCASEQWLTTAARGDEAFWVIERA